MRAKVVGREEDDFGDAPKSGVRAARAKQWLWTQLIDEVQRIAQRACRDVPPHFRVDVESAAMVGLMEAMREFEEVEPTHVDQHVKTRVLDALLAEAARFGAEALGAGKMLQPANDNEPFPEQLLAAESFHAPPDEHSLPDVAETRFVPFSDDTAYEDVPTAEAAFVNSYTKAAMCWALARLDERERLVLRWAYKHGLSLAEIAQRLALSTPRAYQIRVEAERKLAKLLRRSPALSQMNGAGMGLDWDDDSEEQVLSLAHPTERPSAASERESRQQTP